MPRAQRLGRVAMWTAMIVGLATTLALIFSMALPGGVTVGRLGMHWAGAQIELSCASDPLAWAQNRWVVTRNSASASFRVAPSSQWLPSNVGAAAGTTTAPGGPRVLTIESVFVPLLPVWGISVLLAIILRREFPPGPPLGHCRGCGYNLSGLALGAKCPECGR